MLPSVFALLFLTILWAGVRTSSTTVDYYFYISPYLLIYRSSLKPVSNTPSSSSYPALNIDSQSSKQSGLGIASSYSKPLAYLIWARIFLHYVFSFATFFYKVFRSRCSKPFCTRPSAIYAQNLGLSPLARIGLYLIYNIRNACYSSFPKFLLRFSTFFFPFTAALLG